MGEFFGSIYCWFEDFFGISLADYLWGQSSPLQMENMFIGIGLSMATISIVVAVIFYYIINHPRLNNWWGWGIFLVINSIINFFVGWQWVLKDYYAGNMIIINPSTNTDMIISIVFFFIFSMIIKWWSKSCPTAPF